MKEPKIFIKEQNRISFIFLKDISYISCTGNFCEIHLVGEQVCSISKPLKEFEIELADCDFVRINHSTLVNFNHIENIKLGKNGMLYLLDGQGLKISRRRIKAVKKQMK
jgi:DNA-binding LytR/AlgR family response regulator